MIILVFLLLIVITALIVIAAGIDSGTFEIILISAVIAELLLSNAVIIYLLKCNNSKTDNDTEENDYE